MDGTMTYRPIFVSEREVAHTHQNGAPDNSAWEDCVFTSGLMLANTATGGKYPASLLEAENLRDASGAAATGSTTNNQLNLGLSRRYGWTGQRVWGGNFTGFLAAVPVGYAVAFAGSFANFPYGHRLRRFLPNYTGGHEVFAIHEGPNQWWWMDPLGPKDGSYQGEYVTDSDIRTFYIGNSDGGTVVKVLAQAPRPDVRIVPLPAPNPRVWTTKADGNLSAYDPYRPGAPIVTKWFPKGSWAYCDAEVWINQPTRQVPDGGPYIRTVGAGAFPPGLVIVESEITLSAIPVPESPAPTPPPVVPLPDPEPLPDPIPAPLPVPEPDPVPEPEPTPPPVVTLPPYVPPTNEQIGEIIGGGKTKKRRAVTRPGGITDI